MFSRWNKKLSALITALMLLLLPLGDGKGTRPSSIISTGFFYGTCESQYKLTD